MREKSKMTKNIKIMDHRGIEVDVRDYSLAVGAKLYSDSDHEAEIKGYISLIDERISLHSVLRELYSLTTFKLTSPYEAMDISSDRLYAMIFGYEREYERWKMPVDMLNRWCAFFNIDAKLVRVAANVTGKNVFVKMETRMTLSDSEKLHFDMLIGANI